jgi:adenosylcobinamide kinase/adenosylcobinamide-phosphate guanylyltransferase
MRKTDVTKNKIVLIGGGVRSGKSSFAIERGLSLGERRAFIATATRSDDEMNARIDRHQADRRNAFETVEEPWALPDALAKLTEYDVVVVDCLTHWFSNLLLRKLSTDDILKQVDAALAILQERHFHAVLVSNEVGMSVHPPTPLGRAFVEICGFSHQRFARAADEVHLAVLGTTLCIKPSAGAGVTEGRC